MISFVHKLDETAASYRYRALIPARELGASLNDLTADVLVYAKPLPVELEEIRNLKEGQRVIVDVCNDYTRQKWFQEILSKANAITCSSGELKKRLASFGYKATHIDDPYEFEETESHCHGDNLLWFGHAVNAPSIKGRRFNHPLRIVSNYEGAIPWSIETLLHEMSVADIVVIPETCRFNSGNRAVESIRRGCFVVAEPHPALKDIPGIWLGDLEEGIEWAIKNLNEANEWTRQAQAHVSTIYHPSLCGNAWKKICEVALAYTSVVVRDTGTDG